MAQYVMLMRYHSNGLKAIQQDPTYLNGVFEGLERWEAKVVGAYHLLGEWDQCLFVDAPDNFKVYRASLSQEMSTTADTEILPAIDLPLFSRLITQTTETGGPHPWQIKWWAKSARVAMRWYAYSRWAWKYCKPLTITGAEKFKAIDGPCVIVANHSSHMDSLVLFHSLPQRIKWNVYFGAAADRWFLKGRKETTLQPWYQSMITSCFPIQRGGGSKTLDYAKWLLSQGANVMIFPEGTRSKTQSLSKFRHGVSMVALEMGVPVVPVYLAGLRKMRPKDSKQIIPGPAGTHVLDPIYFPEGTSVPDATAAIYQAMNDTHQFANEHGEAALIARERGEHNPVPDSA